jgi:hypothetical protein
MVTGLATSEERFLRRRWTCGIHRLVEEQNRYPSVVTTKWYEWCKPEALVDSILPPVHRLIRRSASF